MHTLQKLLIKRLVEENGRIYSSLTKGYASEDNIAFHLKQLTAEDLIEKRDDKYFITPKGINALREFQKTDLQDNKFKMFFVGFVCKCGDEYLIKPHKNAKDIFYNLPSGSPLFGEKLEEALPRIFYEETNVHVPYTGFTFDSLHMKTVKTVQREILFDDAFAVYTVTITEAQKAVMVLNKGCEWLNKSSIERLLNRWPEIDYCVLRKDCEVYKEYSVTSDYVLR